jgi:hypothetical protein
LPIFMGIVHWERQAQYLPGDDESRVHRISRRLADFNSLKLPSY